jgi:hypothetical protein
MFESNALGGDSFSLINLADGKSKKAHLTIRWAFKYDNIFISKPVSDLSVRRGGWNWHLFPPLAGEVVKASAGHYPQPFLISVPSMGF